MGRESRVIRDRACNSCDESIYATASGLKSHTDLCVRARNIELVLADRIVLPNYEQEINT